MDKHYKEILNWMKRNNLDIRFGISFDNTLYCELNYLWHPVYVKDGIFLCGCVGRGDTFEEAFINMCNEYSAKELVSQYYENNKTNKTIDKTFQFPLIIK